MAMTEMYSEGGGATPQGALNLIPYDNSWTCSDDGHYAQFTFQAGLQEAGVIYNTGWFPYSSSQKYGLVNFNQLTNVKYMSFGRIGSSLSVTDYIDKIQYSTDGTNFIDIPDTEITISVTNSGSFVRFISLGNIDVMAIKILIRSSSNAGSGIKIAFWN